MIEWADVPVVITGVPSASAVGVIMAGIEKFVVNQAVSDQRLALSDQRLALSEKPSVAEAA